MEEYMEEMIRKAIAAHGLWKVRLKDAIRTGHAADVKVEKVARPDECEFGKWFYGLPPAARCHPRAKDVERLHLEFHLAVAKVLRLALDRQAAPAQDALDKGPISALSAELILALKSWEREAQAAVAA